MLRGCRKKMRSSFLLSSMQRKGPMDFSLGGGLNLCVYGASKLQTKPNYVILKSNHQINMAVECHLVKTIEIKVLPMDL